MYAGGSAVTGDEQGLTHEEAKAAHHQEQECAASAAACSMQISTIKARVNVKISK